MNTTLIVVVVSSAITAAVWFGVNFLVRRFRHPSPVAQQMIEEHLDWQKSMNAQFEALTNWSGNTQLSEKPIERDKTVLFSQEITSLAPPAPPNERDRRDMSI